MSAMTACLDDVRTTDARPTVSAVPPVSSDVDELVRVHLALVGHLVRDLSLRLPAHVGRDELTSAGMLALVLAARSFDASRGVPFGRFAAIRIRGALTDELRGMDWASRAVRGKARDLEAARNQLTGALRRTPSRVEIAESLGISVRDIDIVEVDVQRATVVRLQALAPEQSEEMLPTRDDGPETLLLRREQLGYLRDAIAELPERLRTVVEQYFFEQRKMADIAAELGVTESRVSQIRAEALALLRAGMRASDDPQPSRPSIGAGRGRTALSQAYCAAVTARSSLASRLEATTALAEVRPSAKHPLPRAS